MKIRDMADYNQDEFNSLIAASLAGSATAEDLDRFKQMGIRFKRKSIVLSADEKHLGALAS